MKAFADLCAALGPTGATPARLGTIEHAGPCRSMLARYFRQASSQDRLWAAALLSGNRPKRSATTADLRIWAGEAAGIPQWLFDECHRVSGDLAETIALVVPPAGRPGDQGASWQSSHDPAQGGAGKPHGTLTDWLNILRQMAAQDAAGKRRAVIAAWQQLDGTERILFNRLTSGSLRVRVAPGMLAQALAAATGLDATELAKRLAARWSPDDPAPGLLRAVAVARPSGAQLSGGQLARPQIADTQRCDPYPFTTLAALSGGPEALGPPGGWVAQWTGRGVDCQWVLRAGGHQVWVTGPELVTASVPHWEALAALLPQGTVLAGEICATGQHGTRAATERWLALRPASGTGRARGAAGPVLVLEVHDLLEWAGADLRAAPLAHRRRLLTALFAGLPAIRADSRANLPIRRAPQVPFTQWGELDALREHGRGLGAIGLRLLRANPEPEPGAGSQAGGWLWPTDPLRIAVVLTHVQPAPGGGPTAALTGAVWHQGGLVPVARAVTGLPAPDQAGLAAWAKQNTTDRFGPVRQVRPDQVLTLEFDAVTASSRHKSGLLLHRPRLSGWMRDAPVASAATLDDLLALIPCMP